jgi:hypothetical protein
MAAPAAAGAGRSSSWDTRVQGPGSSSAPGVRRRLALAVRHVVRALVPFIREAPASSPPALPDGLDDARQRARRALSEARAEMPTLLAEPSPAPPTVVAEHLASEAVELRQALRAYTDRIDLLLAGADEERRSLREQVDRLTVELLAMRAELGAVRAALAEGRGPAEGRAPRADEPAGAEAPAEPAEVAAPTEHEQPQPSIPAEQPVETPILPAERPEEEARLDARVFPAGTIGVVLAITPIEDAARLAAIAGGLATEPAIEHAEPEGWEEETGRVRVTFRRPVPWPEMRALVASAAGRGIARAVPGATRGEVRVLLGAGSAAAETPPPTPI